MVMFLTQIETPAMTGSVVVGYGDGDILRADLNVRSRRFGRD